MKPHLCVFCEIALICTSFVSMAVVAEKSFVSKDISALPWGIRGLEAFRSSISVGQTEPSRAKTV